MDQPAHLVGISFSTLPAFRCCMASDSACWISCAWAGPHTHCLFFQLDVRPMEAPISQGDNSILRNGGTQVLGLQYAGVSAYVSIPTRTCLIVRLFRSGDSSTRYRLKRFTQLLGPI